LQVLYSKPPHICISATCLQEHCNETNLRSSDSFTFYAVDAHIYNTRRINFIIKKYKYSKSVEGADASSIEQEQMLNRTDFAESITTAFIS